MEEPETCATGRTVEFRTTSPRVLAIHARNEVTRQRAARQIAGYERRVHRDAARIDHGDGIMVVGAKPRAEDRETPPPGWAFDAARELLIPSSATWRGRLLLRTLRILSWNLTPLPGVPTFLPAPPGCDASPAHIERVPGELHATYCNISVPRCDYVRWGIDLSLWSETRAS